MRRPRQSRKRRPIFNPDQNQLLRALSPEDRQDILTHAVELTLARRASLELQEQEPRFVYFPLSAVTSSVVSYFEGASSETLLVGCEGVTSAVTLLGPALSPADCFVQTPGTVLQVPFPVMQRLFRSSPGIQNRILQCVQQQSMTTTQIAACNIAHEACPRLARWLLMVQDRTGGDTFQLTQEFLAQMLGARRPTVVVAAGALQRSGFIEYSRGRVRIVSREKLETAACECYAVTRRLLHDLYQ